MKEQNMTLTGINQSGIKRFQLDSSAVDKASENINLYTRDINLSLKLVNPVDPDGLGLDISTFLNSHTTQPIDTWSREMEKGTLCMGWPLSYDYISFEGASPASRTDGDYYLHFGGNLYRLILLDKDGSGKDMALTFTVEDFPLWEITYLPDRSKEKWQIIQDNGSVLIFGDINSQRNTVQCGTHLENRLGSINTYTGCPEQSDIAWNLSTLTDQWGNTQTYEYQNDELNSTQALNYTRCTYLKRVTDSFGRKVDFYYQSDDKIEYFPVSYYIIENQSYKVFQDRYKTLYPLIQVVRAPQPNEV